LTSEVWSHQPSLFIITIENIGGIPILRNEHIDYEGCALGKMHRNEFTSRLNRKKKYMLKLVHTDIVDPCRQGP